MSSSSLPASAPCPFITEINRLNEELKEDFSTPESIITTIIESNQKMAHEIKEYEEAQTKFRRALICSIIAPDFVSDRDHKVLSDCDQQQKEKEKNFRDTKMKVISYTCFYLRLGGTIDSLAAALFSNESEQQTFLQMNQDFPLFVSDHFNRLAPSHRDVEQKSPDLLQKFN